MKVKKKSKSHSKKAARRPDGQGHDPAILPFIEHAHELRRRLYYIVASIVLWGCVIYGVQQHVVSALLKPARGQHFIYTSPGGGIDFLFRICIYGGIILSLPVIVYNSLRFFEPLLSRPSQRFIALGSIAATLLAAAGVIFGYFVGLPAALHFLLHQFTTVQIQPLVTIQSYLGFVIVYMFGSALLFQLPLFLLFINRIKPLKPKRLLHYERWVILAAFVLAGLMNPTPNIVSQLLIAGPFIIAYQIAIALIALLNRPGRLVHTQRQQAFTPPSTILSRNVPDTQIAKQPLPDLELATADNLPIRRAASLAPLVPSRPMSRQAIQMAQPRRRQFMDFAPRTVRPLAPKLDRLGSA